MIKVLCLYLLKKQNFKEVITMKKLLTFALTFIPTVAYCNLNNVDYSKGATFSDVLEAFSILLYPE